ncbi:Endolytic murein transglycosylase [Pseudoalteromonas holothuriae]|uniref:Endolytic murein transglycosylase n=1 Tax=Pseudoalteromonas holothuriae TaxID=2963714 RepID=A0A9W4QY70_9GAMM|nr:MULTISPECIES: endolytic transglycosylase MltG [unclassified Pseudoalteromonas]CAH9055270.1 Endolytic murein transglycosylase [Pseudoalteromonas sp. CIP111951]CAH9057967.1 Endolytic murein transglycosylase [Pseudoalteromonas sp. CIP111854]
MIKKILLIFALFNCVGVAFIIHQFQGIQNAPFKFDGEFYEVKSGVGFNHLCYDWQAHGFIDSCFKYQVYSKLVPEQFQLKAGVYELANLSVLDAVAKIHRGEQKQFSFTIIAGETYNSVLNKLSKSLFIDYPKDEQQLLAELKVDGNPEGWLLPETYYYEAYTKASALLNRAAERMQLVLTDAWQQRIDELPLDDPYQVLILASIIEKETGYEPERSTIASVFVNRLNRNMRLQTDPTVIYGLGQKFDGDIKRSDLKQYTPYNTYRINGLPPTPIAMPSTDAVYAATQPAQTPYYYFVSKGNGQHQFSKSLREHNQAVQKYILKRSNDS